MPDSWKNVCFHVGVCPEKFQLHQIQNDKLAAIIDFKGILSLKMGGFNNTPQVIVRPIIMLGARWIVKNIKFTKFYT